MTTLTGTADEYSNENGTDLRQPCPIQVGFRTTGGPH